MMRRLALLLAVLLSAASAFAAEGPNGAYVKTDYVLFPVPLSVNPRVVTDANGYLVVTNNTQTAPLSPARPMSNTPMITDSNSYLMVACSGCTPATTADLQINSLGLGIAASGTAGSLKFLNGGIVFPSSDSATALCFDKADAATTVFCLDTTNGRIVLNSSSGGIIGGSTFYLGSVNTTVSSLGAIVSNQALDAASYKVRSVASLLSVTSNFTTAANTNLQTITGLTAALPANVALNVPFQCKLIWSQATAAVAVTFGVQSDTVTPTNLMALGQMETNLTVTSYGDITAVASTTAQSVVTGTPAATATTYNAYIDGFLENPSNASVTNLNIMVKTATAGDAVTVYRGSFCRLF